MSNGEESLACTKDLTFNLGPFSRNNMLTESFGFLACYWIEFLIERVNKNGDINSLSADFFANNSHIMAGVITVWLEF